MTADLPGPVDPGDNTAALADVQRVIDAGPFDATWESLKAYEVPLWYRDAKFGVFLHWGVFFPPRVPQRVVRPGHVPRGNPGVRPSRLRVRAAKGLRLQRLHPRPSPWNILTPTSGQPFSARQASNSWSRSRNITTALPCTTPTAPVGAPPPWVPPRRPRRPTNI